MPEAEDGRSGVEKTTALLRPNLILMDIAMPVMDDLTATRIIRELEGDQIPIIAVTAFGKQYYQEAMDSGCNDLIPKPVDFNTLHPDIEHCLKEVI